MTGRVYPRLSVSRKSGDERFHRSGTPLEPTLLGFWQWSASDLVSNATRGILAEYIVASALGIRGGVRSEWDSFDLTTESGTRVEVKTSAYIQSWYQKGLSKISFDIRRTREWDPETNGMSHKLRRQADVYVFCVLNHKEQATVDPLDLEQWDFYVLSASVLDERCPAQKSIGLKGLLELGPYRAGYEEIAPCIEAAAGQD